MNFELNFEISRAESATTSTQGNRCSLPLSTYTQSLPTISYLLVAILSSPRALPLADNDEVTGQKDLNRGVRQRPTSHLYPPHARADLMLSVSSQRLNHPQHPSGLDYHTMVRKRKSFVGSTSSRLIGGSGCHPLRQRRQDVQIPSWRIQTGTKEM